jgi:tetratricopeptide (TPR) repeat protein
MRPARRPAALALLALLLAACATPLELGERRYREGDRLGALEIWRGVRSDATYYPKVRERIEAVEAEFRQLVVRYKKQAVYYESRGRLAESILSFRLAWKLMPEDRATLAHVQELARALAARKREAHFALSDALARGDLLEARSVLGSIRTLDPFDPELESVARQLDDALRDRTEALLARGRRGFSSGHYRSARSAFEQVLALDAQNESARGYLAYIDEIRAEERRAEERRGEGRRPAAAPEPREPPQLLASDAEIRAEGHHRNALSAAAAGDAYGAIRQELRALDLAPEHAPARRHLEELRRQLRPEVAGLLERGRAHYQEEELQSALDVWQRALLIDPENGEAREYVARAETMLQNLERLRAEPSASAAPAEAR